MIKYKKPEATNIQSVCVVCNKNKQTRKGTNKNGDKTYRALCKPCHYKRYKMKKVPESYRKYKKNKCELCGFIPVHKCQLDVHHIDNNHKNNNIENLQTLCANCHRLKSHIYRLEKLGEQL